MWWHLVSDCTLQSPAARPLMSVVAARLNTIQDVVYGRFTFLLYYRIIIVLLTILLFRSDEY